MTTDVATTAALQDVLAAEHAAVYVYSVLGAQTSQSSQATLYAGISSAYLIHRQRRDDLIARIGELGAGPVAASAAYEVPADLSTAARIEAVALRLERACAATYAYAVASTSGGDRGRATTALLDAARREIGFGGKPEAFPGL